MGASFIFPADFYYLLRVQEIVKRVCPVKRFPLLPLPRYHWSVGPFIEAKTVDKSKP